MRKILLTTLFIASLAQAGEFSTYPLVSNLTLQSSFLYQPAEGETQPIYRANLGMLFAIVPPNTNALSLIDPRALGAVCDGVTDDSIAFSNALVKVTQTGGTIYIPNNLTLKYNGGFTYPVPGVAWSGNYSELWGDMAKSLVNYSPVSGSSGTFLTCSNQLNIRNVRIQAAGVATSGTWNCIVYTNSSPHPILDNVEIDTFSGIGLIFEYADLVDWSRILIYNCGQGCVRQAGFTDGDNISMTLYQNSGPYQYDVGYGVSGGTGSPGNSRVESLNVKLKSELAGGSVMAIAGALGSVYNIQLYSENTTKSVFDIGHDPAITPNLSAGGLIHVNNTYSQGGALQALYWMRSFTNAACIEIGDVFWDNNTPGSGLFYYTNWTSGFSTPLFIHDTVVGGPINYIIFKNGDLLKGTPSDMILWDRNMKFGSANTTSNINVSLNYGVHALGFSNDTAGFFMSPGPVIQSSPIMIGETGFQPPLMITNVALPTTNSIGIYNSSGVYIWGVRGDIVSGLTNQFAGMTIEQDNLTGDYIFRKQISAPFLFLDPSISTTTVGFEFIGDTTPATNIFQIENSNRQRQLWVDNGYNVVSSNSIAATTGYIDYANNGTGGAVITGTNITSSPFKWTNTFGPTFVIKIATTTTTSINNYTNNGVQVGLGPYTNTIVTDIISTNDSLGFSYTGTAPTFTIKKF